MKVESKKLREIGDVLMNLIVNSCDKINCYVFFSSMILYLREESNYTMLQSVNITPFNNEYVHILL